jgi:hypothetical protein
LPITFPSPKFSPPTANFFLHQKSLHRSSSHTEISIAENVSFTEIFTSHCEVFPASKSLRRSSSYAEISIAEKVSFTENFTYFECLFLHQKPSPQLIPRRIFHLPL